MQIHLSIALNGGGQSVAPSAYDTEAAAAFAAMTTPPDDTRKGLINTLIAGVKADGDWSAIDGLCMTAAHHEQAGRLNLRYPAETLTAVNSPLFEVDGGFTPDGATSYLSTGFAPGGAGRVYALNSAHIGCYANKVSANSGQRVQMGLTSGSTMNLAPSTSTTGVARANDATNIALPQPSTASRLGCRIVVRESASLRQVYLAGASVANDTIAPTAIPTAALTFGRSASSYGSDRCAAMFWGAGLSAAAAARVTARITTYLTAIGAN